MSKAEAMAKVLVDLAKRPSRGLKPNSDGFALGVMEVRYSHLLTHLMAVTEHAPGALDAARKHIASLKATVFSNAAKEDA